MLGFAEVTIRYGDGITEITKSLRYYQESEKDDSANIENVLAAMIGDGDINLECVINYVNKCNPPKNI